MEYETCQCECNNYQTYKKGYSWNPNTRISEKSKYLKSIANDSVIACDEIICYGYCFNKNGKYYSKNITANCHSKKVRDCYIVQTVLLLLTIDIHITIDNCYYLLSLSKA